MQNTPLKFVQSKAALENSPYPNLFCIRYLSKILSVLNAIHPFLFQAALVCIGESLIFPTGLK